MATNRDLLKEAIADAKAVKEMAIANAKAALEEAFTPQLKTMLSAKLQEMELEEEEEVEEAEIDEVGFEDNMTLNTGVKEEKDDDKMMEVDLEELLAELAEEEEKMEEAELNESEITEEEMEDESRAERADVDKYEYEKGKEAGEDEGEPLDLEDMTDDDLKKFIEDVIADMVETGELEAGEGAEEEEGEDMDVDVDVDDVDVDVDVEDEEEVDLAELLKEIEDMEEGMKYYEDDVDEAKEEVEEAKEELDEAEMSEDEIRAGLEDMMNRAKSKKELRENMFTDIFSDDNVNQLLFILQQKSAITPKDMILLSKFVAATTIPGIVVGTTAKAVANLAKRIFRKKSPNTTNEAELNEAYDTIKTLKKELNEINLLNAKLLYTNKIFRSKNLTESQKVKVLGSFDNATTVRETKLVYETLNEGIKVKKPSVEKALGSASKATNTPTIKKPIVESNDAYLRMQKLAGLIK
jgi:ABC-type iron transport system FetAB permease component